jgi:hypothetical protein
LEIVAKINIKIGVIFNRIYRQTQGQKHNRGNANLPNVIRAKDTTPNVTI